MEFWPTSTANATTKAELASSRLLQFVMHTEEVAVRTPTQVASDMIHLMAVGIWILDPHFLFPLALISVNSGWKGPLAIDLRHLFAALKVASLV